jgi:hypothetical protein
MGFPKGESIFWEGGDAVCGFLGGIGDGEPDSAG